MLNELRIAAVLISYMLAVWVSFAALEAHSMVIWAISTSWVAFVLIAQFYTPEKKRRNRDARLKK